MITFQRLARSAGAETFPPFRINRAGGRTFDVRHPEMVSLGRSSVHIYSFLDDDSQEPKEREQELSLLLIESVEALERPIVKNRNKKS
jgi:hypothetical protein